MTDDLIITLENMKYMDIDHIVEMYKNGYRIETRDITDLTSLQVTCPSGCINIGYAVVLGSVILAMTVGIISTYLSRKYKV